eukprot:PhM_4_TR8832/c0_g1_i1/m.103991
MSAFSSVIVSPEQQQQQHNQTPRGSTNTLISSSSELDNPSGSSVQSEAHSASLAAATTTLPSDPRGSPLLSRSKIVSVDPLPGGNRLGGANPNGTAFHSNSDSSANSTRRVAYVMAAILTPAIVFTGIYPALSADNIAVLILSTILSLLVVVVVWLAPDVWLLSRQVQRAAVVAAKPERVLDTSRRIGYLEWISADIRNNLTVMFSEITNLQSLPDVLLESEEEVRLLKAGTDSLLIKSYDVIEVSLLKKKSPAEFVDIDIRNELKTAVHSCSSLAQLRNAGIALYVSPTVPDTLRTDQLRFRHAHIHILNFVLNSLSEDGGVVCLYVDVNDDIELEVTVMSSLKLEDAAFNKAANLDQHSASLDLGIAHNSVTSIDGKSLLIRTVDEGSVIRFQFPVTARKPNTLSTFLRHEVIAVLITGLDPEGGLNTMLGRLLRDYGIKVVHVNSNDALEAWLKEEQKEGYIKGGATIMVVCTRATITQPLVMTFLSTLSVDARIALDHGGAGSHETSAIDPTFDVATFPLFYDDFGALVEQSAQLEQRHYSITVPENGELPSLDVLVIDRQYLSRRVLHQLLDDLNQKVVSVGSVIDVAQDYPDIHFSVVFLDVDAAEGIDLVKEFRERDNPSWSASIIAVSSHSPQYTQALCIQSLTPFTMFLCRPIHKDDLDECLRGIHALQTTDSNSRTNSIASNRSSVAGGFLRALQSVGDDILMPSLRESQTQSSQDENGDSMWK